MPFKRRRVKTGSSLGKKFYRARRRKKVSLDEAEAATKVRAKYLEALEKDDFQALPGRVYAVGFVARYAEFLGMDPGKAVDQFRQEYEIFARTSASDQLVLKPKVSEPKIVITPKVIVVTLSILAVVALLGYIGYEVKKFSSPPALEIWSPTQEQVAVSEIEIAGRTSPTAILQINGQNVNLAEDGSFRQPVSLQKGLNAIEVRAVSRAGKETVKILKIFAQLP